MDVKPHAAVLVAYAGYHKVAENVSNAPNMLV
jgi:hypothetical protein